MDVQTRTKKELPTYRRKEIKRALQMLGNRKAICRIIGISNGAYSNWLREGVSPTRIIEIVKLQKAFGVSDLEMKKVVRLLNPNMSAL